MFCTVLPIYVNYFQWKVRRTLAFSIHELAVILGDQLTAADLVPIFNGFLKDLDEVRIGILKHLYDFLKVGIVHICSTYLSPEKRPRFRDSLTTVIHALAISWLGYCSC